MLDRKRAELRDEELRRVHGAEDLRTVPPRTDERAPAGLDRRHELGGAGPSDAGDAAQIIGRRPGESVQAAESSEYGVCEFQRAGARIAMAEHDREQLVVTQPGRPDALELLTRPIVRRYGLHRALRSNCGGCVLLYFRIVRRLAVTAVLLFAIAGCSGPPQKEIDQARSALEAARAAGADKYASTEYTAAAASLEKANAAVGQRDYRQALNYALDSRQRAAEAERQAADGKAQARARTEALYGEVASMTNRLQSSLRSAETAASAKMLRAGQAALKDARAHLQKASAAITAGNLEEATKTLTEVRGKVDVALVNVQNISRSKDAKTKRRG